MKKKNFRSDGCNPLLPDELFAINGGDTPGANTSLANDITYVILYGIFWTVDMVRAFGAGAAKGQKMRFQG